MAFSPSPGAVLNAIQNQPWGRPWAEPNRGRRPGGPLCRGRPPQPDGAGAASCGPGGRAVGHGRCRCGVSLQSVPDAAAEAAGRHRQSRGFRHQDHDGIAAPRRLLNRPAALRIVGQGRGPGPDRPRPCRTPDVAGQGRDGGQEHGDDGRSPRIFRQQATAAGSAQGYLPAILHRLRGQTHAGLCRHQQGIGDVGRTCRRQIAQWNAHGRQAQDHQQRRGGAFRRQCRDEPGPWKSPPAPEPEPEPPPPPKTRSVTGKSANTK